ncbi:MAG: PEP-CTERM sorting domain-containing protein [Candidatus Omnitrophica bacterium]|nr:PEP-CTERM sorting domain-containing protein [Candidatus Omnitrophota bacterium]
MFGRKFALLIMIVAVSVLVFAGTASASALTAYMTIGDEDTTPQGGTPATYNWDQSPWLYFTSPSDTLTYSISWWNAVGDPIMTSSTDVTTDTYDVWHGFSNFADWAEIRKAGYWTVRADYSYAGGYGSTGDISFKINAVPEPISSALFLLGGGAIAVLKLRKKKA